MITTAECYTYKEFVDKYQSYLYPLLGANLSRHYKYINGNIIDMGTGPGYLSCQLAKRTGQKVHAVDINPAMHEIASKEAKKLGQEDRISFDMEDVHKLSYPDNYSDLIVSYSCLHHWENVPKGLQECYRVLAPGGKIIILDTLPVKNSHLDNMNKLIKEPEYFRFVEEAFDESYSLDEMESFLQEANISNYTLDTFNFSPEDFIDCMDEIEMESMWEDEGASESNGSVTWVLTITK